LHLFSAKDIKISPQLQKKLYYFPLQ